MGGFEMLPVINVTFTVTPDNNTLSVNGSNQLQINPNVLTYNGSGLGLVKIPQNMEVTGNLHGGGVVDINSTGIQIIQAVKGGTGLTVSNVYIRNAYAVPVANISYNAIVQDGTQDISITSNHNLLFHSNIQTGYPRMVFDVDNDSTLKLCFSDGWNVGGEGYTGSGIGDNFSGGVCKHTQ